MIIAMTGAGISAESGIRTYRAHDGLWEDHSIEDVATPDGFRRNPDMVNSFYDARLDSILAAKPNAAHVALSRLESLSAVPVLIITQNIDDLHERAGSRNVIHMHGKVGEICCSVCEERLDPGRASGHTPCPECGGASRPDITWFGEMPKKLDTIADALKQCSMYLSIGTSGEVMPAASFVRHARKRKASTVEFNLGPTETSRYYRESRRGPASLTLPAFVDRLLEMQRGSRLTASPDP
ncbi:NAD-dependent deacylase [Paracoccus litorisediminis]|uniref:NAD-dependent deacylase n=1 Tax=Paracoccus litorisediminis TaxID=2006130 RepID=UPI003734B9B6